MRALLLIHRRTAPYAISDISSRLESIKRRWGFQFRLWDVEGVPEEETDFLRAQIREIIPQRRGRIVSSGGKILPLSHSRKLNVDNTPILILYDNGKPLQVYPHMLGKAYVTVEDGLNRILETGSENESDMGLLEPTLQSLLAGDPSMLEKGATCLGVEMDVGFGVADLVLEGGNGNVVVVEVKTSADDSAVGQVTRIAKGYSMKVGIDTSRVRKAIVCVTFNKNLVEACRGAGIELYVVGLRRVVSPA